MLYGVTDKLTSAWGTQVVEPLGRCARRTSTQLGAVAITGRIDGYPYHVPGTKVSWGAPGSGDPGTSPCTVATRVVLLGAEVSLGSGRGTEAALTLVAAGRTA